MRFLISLLFIAFLFCSCQNTVEEAPLTVAVSWCYPNDSFQNWLAQYSDEVQFYCIYDLDDDQIDEALSTSSGFLLTGGCDVDPACFGQPEELSRCGRVDPRRDSLEVLMIKKSFENQIPLLGVCRGLQMMNIVAGGSLIIDLPTDRGTSIHQLDSGDARHEVVVTPGSHLHHISRCLATEVNSNHHQAIDELGDGYQIEAWSNDSIIEAIYWSDTIAHPFAMGIQWHPERLEQRNPMAGRIAREFLGRLGQ